jgi:anti-sigma regulatory factor (Ser/Thr protein kinase)
MMAREEGLDETQIANISLIATEVCTNLLKHAQRGEVFLSRLSGQSGPGLEILAVDRGPGMIDVSQCLADGYSSSNTPGTGLGAVARTAQEFDIYSERNKGTVLMARVGGKGNAKTIVGALVKPIAGEDVAGDAWDYCEDASGMTLVVADGLGHGLMAARASAEAVSAFRRATDFAPVPVLTRIHGSLRGTRGAAVAVARVDSHTGTVRYAGIGNISGVIIKPGKPVAMVSHNGTAGFHAPRLQEFSYQLPPESVIVMHSDGLTTSWNLDQHIGLRSKHPSVIAGVLYRDASRNRDDVCVVAAKPLGV